MADGGARNEREPNARSRMTTVVASALAPLVEGARSLVARRPASSPNEENGRSEVAAESAGSTKSAKPSGQTVVAFVDGELRFLRRVGGRVVDWGHFPLPPDAFRDGAIADAPSIGLAMAEAFGEFRLPSRRVVAAIPARDARAGLLSLSWVKESDLADVVADEAPRALGVPLDTHYVFWQKVAVPRAERRTFVVAVPREPILALLEACEVAGVTLESLDLSPLALARAANQRDAVVVAVEPRTVEIVVVADDLPLYFRTVTPGANPTAADVAAEVGRALTAYEEAFPERGLDPTAPVFLVGQLGAARSAELAGPIGARAGRRVGRPSPPLHLPADFPLAEQMVNVGLALKEL